MKSIALLAATLLLLALPHAGNANAQTLTNLYSFGSDPSPFSGLVKGSDGNVYGTTVYGATSVSGTVFRVSSSGGYTNLYAFAGSYIGEASPGPWLVQGSDNNFYGTTGNGGLGIHGTVFRINSSGVYTTLYVFAGFPTDGAYPRAGLVQGSDSNFYGTTWQGGTTTPYCEQEEGCGTVFQITASGSYTSLYSFPSYLNDGYYPEAGLVQGSDGNLYGTTFYGGESFCSCGTVFRINPSGGGETILYSFSPSGSSNDGEYPQAGLVQGSDSNFYGTTSEGGTITANCDIGCGTIFRINPSGTYTSLYSFGSSSSDGYNPIAGLVQGSDGNLYGTTSQGGTYGSGTVFRISPSGSYTNLYSFGSRPNDGSNPENGLVEASDGNLYGMTFSGGMYGNGTVFELAVRGGGSTNCTFSINPTNAVFDAAGGSDSVSVTASNGCSWTASTTNSWITITSGSSGSGDGTPHYRVLANTSTNALTGTMTIAGQTFTVTQSGASVGVCTYTLNATSVTLAAKGGSKNVSVKVKGTDCAWTAVSNDPFITITSGSSGTGNGKVDYTVPGNTNTTALSGTMTVAGQTFTVNQAAGGCAYSLSPKTGKIKATGGAATVKVKPNFNDCAWTAVSNDSFITITDGASGLGKGTVSYTVTVNTNTTALVGSITIAGETFTVTQSGAK